MKHKYKVNITWDPDDKIYVAEVPELDGCMSHGKTEFEALKNVEKAIDGWIHTAKEFNMPIPEPLPAKKFSGSFNVRIPRDIHRGLVLKATENKISLNHLVSQILSRAV
ncbi:MAG: type II toxin-antitoxin system HicB family antitoxin [Deltaproteobacteria bacterium]|nr:type II toxin-antitoxin system HicB family antitoxin [Deltaproteobacteria bacterium]